MHIHEDTVLKMMQALSDGTRLQIVRFLVQKLPEGASAGEIAAFVNASSSRASFHLSTLEQAQLVTSKKKSRHVVYTLNSEQMGELVSFLLNDCCANHPDIIGCCKG
ncbi:ArsR/SmtB family transcription factor [Halovulum sp. GXIMD14793]